jgi:hypothetical protein
MTNHLARRGGIWWTRLVVPIRLVRRPTRHTIRSRAEGLGAARPDWSRFPVDTSWRRLRRNWARDKAALVNLCPRKNQKTRGRTHLQHQKSVGA